MNFKKWFPGSILVLLVFIASHLPAISVPVQSSLSDFISALHPSYISLYRDTIDDNEIQRIVKFGFNADVDSGAAEEIWTHGGLQTFAQTAQTVDIVSDDINDDDGDTGAESLRIEGLDGSGLEITEDITLNGTGAVVSVNSYMFIYRVNVLSSGSSDHNEGNITLTQTTSSIVLAHIAATYSSTHMLSYRIPANKRCYINNFYISADKQSGADPRVTFEIKKYSTVKDTAYIIRRELLDTASTSHRNFANFKDNGLIDGEILYVEVSSDSNNTEVSGTIDLICRVL